MSILNEQDTASRQKRFGQYFSGKKVADLLVALLPKSIPIKSAIDPMVGVGDMLSALKAQKEEVDRLVGIEIDKTIIQTCRNNVPFATIRHGDAFAKCRLNGGKGWDLVITNPPYIRYQLLTDEDNTNKLPSSEEIRKNLISTLSSNRNLSVSDKALFLRLAKNYSGLSDMAVPSWILCASLVRQDGLLAMVVPDTWLNREYALPVQYLLLKCFDILTVVTDTSAVWFDNAQVRTCLVVAKRKKTESFQEALRKQTYCISLKQQVIGKSSLVGNFSYRSLKGPEAFFNMLQERPCISSEYYSATEEKTYALFPQMLHGLSEYKWFAEQHPCFGGIELFPVKLKNILKEYSSIPYQTLSERGWGIGQGLRTGANDFFYGKLIEEDVNCSLVESTWYQKPIVVNNTNLLAALQNRSSINGLYVSAQQLQTRVLYIINQVRPQDYDLLSPDVTAYCSIMDDDLATYITAGEKHNPSSSKSSRPFPERSAVAPNVRKCSSGYTRFWYMLPEMVNRHQPSLCLPRVCGSAIECLFVEQAPNQPIAVDANFTTLWHNSPREQRIAFALLNSSWFKCYIECVATVMGGGALKVEANHIRKVLFPQYSAEQLQLLADCADQLLEAKKMTQELQDRIDAVVVAPFENATEIINEIRLLLNRKLLERGAKNDES